MKNLKLVVLALVAAAVLFAPKLTRATSVDTWPKPNLHVTGNLTVDGAISPPPTFYSTQTVTAAQLTSTYGVNAATATISGAATVGTTLSVGTTLGVTGKTTLSNTVTETYGVAASTGVFSGSVSAVAISNVGALTNVGAVTISTSATSSLACSYRGAVQTLGTGTECDTEYQISDHTLYVATKTATVAADWKACW